MEIAGLVGKPNCGKSTLFSALTLAPVKIASYPFTTKEPNHGVTYIRIDCVCKDLNVSDNPKNSLCVEGKRMVPINIVDTPGIIKDAHKGRGMGLHFLDEIRQASLFIVVCDASGSTDLEGNPAKPLSHDPVDDVKMVEREIVEWVTDIIWREWGKIVKAVDHKGERIEKEISRKLSGLGIREAHVERSISESSVSPSKPSSWSRAELVNVVTSMLKAAKPIVVAANKIDVEGAEEGFKRLKREGYEVIPTSAEAERLLRLAAERGLVKYLPGERGFKIVDPSKLNSRQKRALDMIRERVFDRWGSTGVQELVNKAYLDILGYVPVYPVEDVERLSDKNGNVLPDVYLMPKGSTVVDLAYKIHSDIGKGFMFALDARSKVRVGEDYVLKRGDVISIVSRAR